MGVARELATVGNRLTRVSPAPPPFADGHLQVRRKAAALLHYLLQQSQQDREKIAVVPGVGPVLIGMAGDEDLDARYAALQALFELLKDAAARAPVLQHAQQLEAVLQRLAAEHAGLGAEDADARREEVMMTRVVSRALAKAAGR